MAENPLQQSVQVLAGCGPERALQLGRLGIETVRDLLFHLPRSYEDLTDIRSIPDLRAGTLQTVAGEVVEINGNQLVDGRTVVSVVLAQGSDIVEGVWFNQVYMSSKFRYGQRVSFSGKPKRYRGHWQMSNPRVQFLDSAAEAPTPSILPVYPLTQDLGPGELRLLIRGAVEQYATQVPDLIPESLRAMRGFPQVVRALFDVHLPRALDAARAARRRFLYEEFLVLQAALAVRRRSLRDRLRAPILVVTSGIDQHIRQLFPYRLTPDQDRAIADIRRDLAGQRPMQRLLQADVGAGKTAVAVYALLAAVANKHQGVLMAPTEVLAQQHWRTVETLLGESRVRRAFLTGALAPAARRRLLEQVAQGEVDLVVGTQALVQKDVQFARLGLVVIDEQHKFGVNQRARLRRLGADPHYLVMTATPIPRTVALTVFGDLDASVIREPPPGRRPPVTRLVPREKRERLYDHVRGLLRQGRQAFVVCPLIEESLALDVKAAIQTHAELVEGPFSAFKVGLLHGALNDQEKDRVMEEFRRGDLDLLVSTSVIEVGVDVPNATVLVVEHAERFGLSQLHQLRGRISRGSVSGQCFLFADPPTDEARDRIRIFTRTVDGFALAEHDVRLRGVGEFFGLRQHGAGELPLTEMLAERDLLEQSRQDAIALVGADGGLSRPEHALLRQAILDRYGRTLDLATIG